MMKTQLLPGRFLILMTLICGFQIIPAPGFGAVSEPGQNQPNPKDADGPGSEEGPEGIIAFASLGTRHWDLYAWRQEGDTTPITDHPALDYNASFSPDGKRLAFVSRRDGNLEIYLKNLEDAKLRRLTVHHAMDDHPTWSPDGSRIAFVSTRQAAPAGTSWNAIYVMKVDGEEVRRLSPEGASDFSPAWSPHGGRIAFTSGNGGGDLYVMNPDGSQRKLVVQNGGWPTFLEGGRSLAFHRQGEGNRWDVWRINLDGTGLERMAEDASMPRATFDGTKVALVRRDAAQQQIGILDLRSGEIETITHENTDHWNPAIAPDGRTVLYHRTRPGLETPNVERWEAPPETRLHLLRLDGSFPAFSPDHLRVSFLNGGFSRVDVMRVDGSERTTIFEARHRTLFGMSWSAAPERIAFSHGAVFVGASISVNIKAVAPDGRDLRELTADTGNNGFPSYSPDGRRMVFRSGRDGAKNLYIMDRDGDNVSRLTEGAWTDTMCHWSPTGEWIAFASDRDDNYEIWLIRPDGSDLHKLIGGGGRNNHPIFSPDGRWIVFTSQRAGLSAETVSMPRQPQPYGDLFVVRLDGTHLTRVTHNAFEEGTPAWGAVVASAE